MQDDDHDAENVVVGSTSEPNLDGSKEETSSVSAAAITPATNPSHPTEELSSSQQPSDESDSLPKKKRRSFKPELMFPKGLRAKLGKAARPLSIVIILIVVGGIGFGIWKHANNNLAWSSKAIVRFQDKIVPFKVIGTSPSKNQINVTPQTTITINFSQPVDATKLQGNLFVTPNVTGKFTQGKTTSQVVFTPSVPFAQGTKVQVMLNGTYQSKQGSKLGADYLYGFTTALPPDGVIFQDPDGLYANVSSLQSGQKETYSLQFGSSINTSVTVNLYKSDMSSLLSSLVYASTTSNGYTYPAFLAQPINTSGMKQLSSQASLGNNGNFSVSENSGIYLAVATDSKGEQLGHVWIDYSDFGVIVRQDDQQIVADAQSFSNSSDIPATVQIYNLNNSVNQLNQSTVDGITTIPTAYTPSTDVMVASDGTSQAIVPLSILESQGDIRVDQNLSSALSVFGVTDRPTYSASDTVNYAGYVRANDDAQYGSAKASVLNLYVSTNQGWTALANFTATPDANGMFSGSFNVSPSWLSGNNNGQFQIYVASPDGKSTNDVQLASFTVTNQPNPTDNLVVSFSKSSYLPTDTIQATVTGTNANGTPLANAQVEVNAFSEDYYENNPTANLANFDNTGLPLNSAPTKVQLNSTGQAVYTLPVSALPNAGTSQQVTVQANLAGVSNPASGGASTIVHQGNGLLSFGVGTSTISSTGNVLGKMYATNLDGSPMSGATINYVLEDSNTLSHYVSGSVVANANGYALISLAIPSNVNAPDGLELNAWITDAQNNKIQATNYYGISNSPNDYDTNGAVLQDIDVSGSSGQLSVGQNVNLNINSPAALNALVTMDRGRIYNPQMVQLKQGDNNFSFAVTANLAPSFTLTFNYLENGVYHSEGVQFMVTNQTKQASIVLTPSSGSTVKANSQTSVQINAKDSSGNPLQTDLIASVTSENSYNLYNQVVPDMYTSLYQTLPIMTNSSSSLSSIGSGGGGRCGGGMGGPSDFTNPIGTTLSWQPEIATDSSGNATLSFTPPQGVWQITVYSMSSNTVVGSATTAITAN